MTPEEFTAANATLTACESRLTTLVLCLGEVSATGKRSPRPYRFRPRFQNRHDRTLRRQCCSATIRRSSCDTARAGKEMQSTTRSPRRRRRTPSRTSRLSPGGPTPFRTNALPSRRISGPGDMRSPAEHVTPTRGRSQRSQMRSHPSTSQPPGATVCPETPFRLLAQVVFSCSSVIGWPSRPHQA